MRNLLRVLLCGFILIAPIMAQRGGGGGRGGGGMGGGGFRGGGGFGGGGFRFGFRNNFGFRRFNRFNSFNAGFPFGFGYGYGWGYPYDDFAYYDSPAYNSFYGYGYPTDYSSAYVGGTGGYGAGGYYAAAPQPPSSNVVVVYPPQASPSTVIVDRASPVVREYDEFGQELGPRSRAPIQAPAVTNPPGESPVYLIALRSGEIRAAVAYWVEGSTLRFVTSDHLERQVPLSSVDRDLSVRLNRERQVVFALPAPK